MSLCRSIAFVDTHKTGLCLCIARPGLEDDDTVHSAAQLCRFGKFKVMRGVRRHWTRFVSSHPATLTLLYFTRAANVERFSRWRNALC